MRPIVFLAVDERTSSLTADDQIFADALARAGLAPQPLRWGALVNPGSTIVIRSTWDYVERPAHFAQWLDHLDAQQAMVLNATKTLRWSMHKGYLRDLALDGVATVDTDVVRRGESCSLREIMERRKWRDVVIKPAVGGTSRLTVHYDEIGHEAASEHLLKLLANEDVVVQPYLPSITDVGEISVIAIGGDVHMALVKTAKPGEWRVQADFGGTCQLTALTGEIRNAAVQALAAVSPTPAYARVDLVRGEDGMLQLLELELVEPELFFRLDPTLAERFARHLASRLGAR